MRRTPIVAVFLVQAFLCGFCFRLGESRLAANPTFVACGQWACIDQYSWNPGTLKGTQCYTAQVPGSKWPWNGTANTTNALVNFYTPASTGKLPINPSGTFDRWIFPSFNNNCRNGNTYPMPNTVIATGSPPTPDTTGVPRFTCS